MALVCLFVLTAMILGFISGEPDYCKRGVKVSEAYQHCFEEAHFEFPYRPLFQPREVYDGCFVEAYANHTCSLVKPKALECFMGYVDHCDHKQRLYAVADQSGGACSGNHVNWQFKEHVLNYLQPVRGDSGCFLLADRVYECYLTAGAEMVDNNPNLQLMSVDEYRPVANQFFDTIYNCFIEIYKSNRPICENWQIPLLLEIQGTALPSLFGMTFTADEMDKLGLHDECPTPHLHGPSQTQRTCVDENTTTTMATTTTSTKKKKPPSKGSRRKKPSSKGRKKKRPSSKSGKKKKNRVNKKKKPSRKANKKKTSPPMQNDFDYSFYKREQQQQTERVPRLLERILNKQTEK